MLIQASSSAILAYTMQCAHLPNKILQGIDRVNRNFLWGSTKQTRKMHWVKWEKVTKLKDLERLGLQSAKERNITLLAKLNWRLHTERNSMWARVIKMKYDTRQRINSGNYARLLGSPIWKGLIKGEGVFRKWTKWIPGNEINLSFWWDCWSNFGPIRQITHGPLTQATTDLKIKDVISSSGWN